MKRDSLVSSEALDPRRWWTLAVLCLSLLVIGLDNTILNVAFISGMHTAALVAAAVALAGALVAAIFLPSEEREPVRAVVPA